MPSRRALIAAMLALPAWRAIAQGGARVAAGPVAPPGSAATAATAATPAAAARAASGTPAASAVLPGTTTSAGSGSAAAPTAASRAPRPIFVLNSLDADVSLIDPRTFATIRRIPTGKEPHHLYLTPDEKSVIVANALGNSLTFIDPVSGEVQRTLHNVVDPYHLRFSPDMKWFVTAANRLNHVDIYRWQPSQPEPLLLARRIPAAKTPSHLAIDSRSTVVYASLQDSDELTAIDLATQARLWTISVGKMPADIFLAPDDRLLFVGLTGDKVVEVWDVSASPPRLVKRIPTGDGAHAFRGRGDRRHLFVSNRVANTISLIDMPALAVVAELPAPGGPDCMELLADGRTLLVSSRWIRKLTFVDVAARRVVRQVDVGRSPHGVWTLDHAPRL
jgi:YVTN family beta-propeller protein